MLKKYTSDLKTSIEKLEVGLKSAPPIVVRQCMAEGCDMAVFWDYKTEFQYCSPECRDNDLLVPYSLKLKSDIEGLEKLYSSLPPGGHALFVARVQAVAVQCAVYVNLNN